MIEFDFKKPVDPEKFRAPIKLAPLNDILINSDYQDLLTQQNLKNFDLIWNLQGGDTFKKIPDRSVTRLDFEHNGNVKTFYLKRHNPERFGNGYRYFVSFVQDRLSQGIQELYNIVEFRDHGLATVIPVAAGAKKIGNCSSISFLITEDFSPFISLEWIILNQPDFFNGSQGRQRKQNLLETIGGFARKMHNAGLNHKDFNATHILLYYGEQNLGKPLIGLFDLQRVGRKNLLSFRWIIKSLAEINYTLPDKHFSDNDRRQLFIAYKGTQNSGCWEQFQQWWIKRKVSRIAKHTKNIRNRKQSEKMKTNRKSTHNDTHQKF